MMTPFKQLVIKRLFAENILLFLFQYTGLTLATLIKHPLPIAFAPGVCCAFIFMRGFTVLPGLFLGGMCAYWLAGATPAIALGCAGLLTLQAGLLLALHYRFIGPTLIFSYRIEALKFILLSSAVTAGTSGCLVITCFQIMDLQVWLHSWLANLGSLYVFSFAIMTWDYYFADFKWDKWSRSVYSLFTTGMIISLVALIKDSAEPCDLWIQLVLLISAPVAIYFATDR